MNKFQAAKDLANNILEQYGLSSWDIKITNSRTALAITDHDYKTLELSKRFVMKATKEQFTGIMLHEVAHIIAGPGKGHGTDFLKICSEIGLDKDFSCTSYPIHIKSYKYLCESCGTIDYYNTNKKLLCKNCMISKQQFVNLKTFKNIIELTAW